MSLVVQSGKFKADGNDKFLNIRSDVDHIEVVNYSNSITTDQKGVKYTWSEGMPEGKGLVVSRGANEILKVAEIADKSGFYRVKGDKQRLGSPVAVTATDAHQQVDFTVDTADTSGLSVGSVVRLYSIVDNEVLAGIDYTVGAITANTDFTISYPMANLQASAGGAGHWAKVFYDAKYYPSHRSIANITKGNTTTITFTVDHEYRVGQVLKFNVDPQFGMVELDGKKGTVTSVDISAGNNSVTVDIDSNNFTAYKIPDAYDANNRFTWPKATPAGIDTAVAIDKGVSLNELTSRDTEKNGVYMVAGDLSPAGAENDIIYWKAFKSSFRYNEVDE